MNLYKQKQIWKVALLVLAVIIAMASLLYTNSLVNQLAEQELKKVQLVADATENITSTQDFSTDLSFSFAVIQENNTVPVILTSAEGEVLSWRNLDSSKVVRDPNYLQEVLEEMKVYHEPIAIEYEGQIIQYIYFKPSYLIDLLRYYPFIQLTIISIFILIAYVAFSYSRNAEQNQVWVGMSKETAHQLGTPLSSLYGWMEILKTYDIDPNIPVEIEKDLDRLTTITDRFSKIGSQPKLEEQNLNDLLTRTINYLKVRLSQQIHFTYDFQLDKDTTLPLNKSLIEWVIENLTKNAADAMSGQGTLSIIVHKGSAGQVYIDVRDSGKGMAKREFKKIFKPGFTTKTRGWGLGLSLVKRIIEQYHFGKVYVKESDQGKGSLFRISLNPEVIRKSVG